MLLHPSGGIPIALAFIPPSPFERYWLSNKGKGKSHEWGFGCFFYYHLPKQSGGKSLVEGEGYKLFYYGPHLPIPNLDIGL